MLKNCEIRFYSMIEDVNLKYEFVQLKVIFNYGRNMLSIARNENIDLNFEKIEQELQNLADKIKHQISLNLELLQINIQKKELIDIKLIPFNFQKKEDIIKELNFEYDVFYKYLIELKNIRTFLVNESKYFDKTNSKSALIEILLHKVIDNLNMLEELKELRK